MSAKSRLGLCAVSFGIIPLLIVIQSSDLWAKKPYFDSKLSEKIYGIILKCCPGKSCSSAQLLRIEMRKKLKFFQELRTF